MTGCYSCAIVALLIYLHSTNAASTFTDDREQIEGHLRKENSFFKSLSKTLIRNLSFGKRTNIVCDVLDQKEKQCLCDKIMKRMIENEYGDVFVSFVEPDNDPLPAPHIVDLDNPYSCKKISIEDVGMEKRMFWCKSRLYIRGGTLLPIYQREAGFFCAGSRETKGRVFAFRTEEPADQSVHAAGEMDNVGLIIEKVAGVPAIDDSTSTSSSSSELF